MKLEWGKWPERMGTLALSAYMLLNEAPLAIATIVQLTRTAAHTRTTLLVEGVVAGLVMIGVASMLGKYVPAMRYTFFAALEIWRKENWDLLKDAVLEGVTPQRLRQYRRKRYLWCAFLTVVFSVHLNHMTQSRWWTPWLVAAFVVSLLFLLQAPLYGLVYAVLVDCWLVYAYHGRGLGASDVEALIIAILTAVWLLHGALIKNAEPAPPPQQPS